MGWCGVSLGPTTDTVAQLARFTIPRAGKLLNGDVYVCWGVLFSGEKEQGGTGRFI